MRGGFDSVSAAFKHGWKNIEDNAIDLRDGKNVFDAEGIEEVRPRQADNITAFYVDNELVEAREVWNVGADEPTSDEDHDGNVKPKRGAGRTGVGAPLQVNFQGKVRPFADGAGLCSPGRWLPHQRVIDSIASKMKGALMELLRGAFDIEKLAYELALGRHDRSPFTDELLREGRRRLVVICGGEGDFEKEPSSRQPFYLKSLSLVARVLGDPDWRILACGPRCYEKGVPVGFRTRLPRTPAVYERKRRWRRYDPADSILELKSNYKSVDAALATLEEQFAEEVREGRMVRMSLAEARRKYGAALRIAPQGAIEKQDNSFRAIHDGTHGPGVNPNIRIRDQIRFPSGGEAKRALEWCSEQPGATWGLTADVSKAHRRFKHPEDEWGLLACRLGDPLVVFCNAVGTFGVGSASYWWSRLFGIPARVALAIVMRSPFSSCCLPTMSIG